MAVITIITLAKDNLEEFIRTARSISCQHTTHSIYWIVADGSSPTVDELIQETANKYCSSALSSICLRYESTRQNSINGIYPSFNYANNFLQGDSVIYLNSGDSFCHCTSLDSLCQLFFRQDKQASKVVFGRAVIISPYGLQWFFPGCSPSAIYHWLRCFEPNHQSMLVSSALAKKIPYDSNLPSSADKVWKRTVLNSADVVLFCPSPVVNFFLGGISSTPLSRKLLLAELLHRSSSIFSKFTLLLKSLLPASFLPYYYKFMMYKSCAQDLYFSLIAKIFSFFQAISIK